MRILALTVVVLLNATAVSGADHDLCVRGIADGFVRTTRVRLSLEGAPLSLDLKTVAARLLREVLWGGRTDEVFVEIFSDDNCAAALGESADVSVSLTPMEAERLANADRGSGDSNLLRQIAERVAATRCHAEHATHDLHAVLVSMTLDELVQRADSLRIWSCGHRHPSVIRRLASIH